MALVVAGKKIETVGIVDDEASVRDAYRFNIEDLKLNAIVEPGPIRDPIGFVAQIASRADAVLCDHHLKVKEYAVVNGAELVAQWYDRKFPAVLCTKWEEASVDELRRFRKRIPALLKPAELNPDSFLAALSVCIEEHNGRFRPSRQAWRTLVRIEDVDAERGYVFVIVPGWTPSEVVRLVLRDIPESVWPAIVPDARVHAKVNLTAEGHDELFFEDWEPQ